MSNILDFQCSRNAPSKIGGIGTPIKYFPRPLGQSLTSGLPSTPSGPPNANATGSLWVPTGPSFDGQLFDVYAVGTVGSGLTDPSTTFNVFLQVVTGTAAAPVYTTICSTGAVTASYPTPIPWMIQASLFGDSVTGFLCGTYTAMQANAINESGNRTTSAVAIDNVITGIDFVNGLPALQRGAAFGLVVGVQFGTSNTGNTASMTSFTVES